MSDIQFCVPRSLPIEKTQDAIAAALKANLLNAAHHFNAHARLALKVGKMWPPGHTLRCHFLGGSELVQTKVKQYAAGWTTYANIKLEFVDSDPAEPAEIRISFDKDKGTWTIPGTDCLSVPPGKPTMNYSWFDDTTSDMVIRQTTLHEFGHALGCVHEHQQPNADIHWNKPAVYAAFLKLEGWTKELVDEDVIDPVSSRGTSSTDVDSLSIMAYAVPSEWTTDGSSFSWNSELSKNDKIFIRRMYPYPPTEIDNYRTINIHTMAIRDPSEPALGNPIPIEFNPAFDSPPRVLMGLNRLEFGNTDNLRVRCKVEDNIRTDGMTINMQSWGNTVQYSSGCSILFPPSYDILFQYGHFSTEDDHPANKPQQTTSRRIEFTRAFQVTPKVVVWFDELDVGNSADLRVKAYATDITQDGFTVHIDTWADTVLVTGSVFWAAHSSTRKGIASGTYSTGDTKPPGNPPLQNCGTVSFEGAEFSLPPQIFFAINNLDMDHRTPFRVNLSVDNINTTEMDWHIDSWDDTILHAGGASFIAVG